MAFDEAPAASPAMQLEADPPPTTMAALRTDGAPPAIASELQADDVPTPAAVASTMQLEEDAPVPSTSAGAGVKRKAPEADSHDGGDVDGLDKGEAGDGPRLISAEEPAAAAAAAPGAPDSAPTSEDAAAHPLPSAADTRSPHTEEPPAEDAAPPAPSALLIPITVERETALPSAAVSAAAAGQAGGAEDAVTRSLERIVGSGGGVFDERHLPTLEALLEVRCRLLTPSPPRPLTSHPPSAGGAPSPPRPLNPSSSLVPPLSLPLSPLARPLPPSSPRHPAYAIRPPRQAEGRPSMHVVLLMVHLP